MPFDPRPAGEHGDLPADEASDPIGARLQAGGGAALPMREALERAEAIFARHSAAATPEEGLAHLLDLVAVHPEIERLQLLAVRLQEARVGRQRAIPAWTALRERFPACAEAFLITLRWAFRTHGREAALREIQGRFPAEPESAEEMLLRARAEAELGEAAAARERFAALLRAHPGFETGWLMLAQQAERAGDPWEALRVLRQGQASLPAAPRIAAGAARLAEDVGVLGALPEDGPGLPPHAGRVALARLLRQAGEARAAVAPPASGRGPILMATGSLGAGGAERQLVNTAIGVKEALAERAAPCGPVLVACRSLDDRPAADFFLPQLRRAGIGVLAYGRLPEFGGDPEASLARDCRPLLRFLAPRTAAGAAKLADRLAAMAPRVVHLWQDGTILEGALAALLARVPRIVLSVRTAPPPDRPERAHPEYEALYRNLLDLPGVVMTANSHYAAGRYARWIGIDPARVRVVPNGLAPLPQAGTRDSQAMLEAFDARTGPGFTLGTVIRFDENKRPLGWLDCAAKLLERRPDARFVMIGDGPLREAAEAYARALGLYHRVLFAGRVPDVGYWLAHLDAFLLLSRCEGLPNALIEAQAAGVPVVSTPAGGAAETLLHGRTGFLLGSAERPSPEEAAARLALLAGARAHFSGPARRFVGDTFSLARMTEQTMELYGV